LISPTVPPYEMGSLRSHAVTLGSAVTLLAVILAISNDAETAVALVAFCAVGYAGRTAVRSSDRFDRIRSSLGALGPRARTAVGAVVTVAAIAAVTSEAGDALLLTGVVAIGYVGYRSGAVLRGALYGAVLGVGGGVSLVVVLVVALGLSTALGVSGTQDLLVKTLYAPWLVGGLGLLWTLAATAFGGVFGAAFGGAGGAIARLG